MRHFILGVLALVLLAVNRAAVEAVLRQYTDPYLNQARNLRLGLVRSNHALDVVVVGGELD